jgi:hypothetical protein
LSRSPRNAPSLNPGPEAAEPVVAPIDRLPQLEIPGLAEARQREAEIRDRAFLPIPQKLAGIPVRPFCLRHLLTLDYLRNGFVVPCLFERPSERVAHALQFIGIVSTLSDLPAGPFFELRLRIRKFFAMRAVRRAIRCNADEVFAAIKTYIDEAMYDCPKSSGDGRRSVPTACFLASYVDDLAGAGYPFSEEEIFTLPLSRLFQYWRMSRRRLDPDLTLPNPSDALADQHIARLNAVAAANAALANRESPHA